MAAMNAVPPDPDRYDSPRDLLIEVNRIISDLGAAMVEERRLSRWLVIMVVTIVGSGFVIGTILALVGPTVTR